MLDYIKIMIFLLLFHEQSLGSFRSQLTVEQLQKINVLAQRVNAININQMNAQDEQIIKEFLEEILAQSNDATVGTIKVGQSKKIISQSWTDRLYAGIDTLKQFFVLAIG